MSAPRVALVDLSLADCDRLGQLCAGRLEIALVVVEDAGGAVARWAELGGYPCTADLRRLAAVIADTVAVGAGSPRREQALALASVAGVRGVVLGERAATRGTDAAGSTSEAGSNAAALSLDDAFAQLFGAAGSAGA